jgi:hypothetical protein
LPLGQQSCVAVFLGEKVLRCAIICGNLRRILIVTTKSMMTQFQKELWPRFTISLVRLDRAGIEHRRQASLARGAGDVPKGYVLTSVAEGQSESTSTPLQFRSRTIRFWKGRT